jgi:hypothetical protein
VGIQVNAVTIFHLLPDAFHWNIAEQNGATTTLEFKPDPGFDPPTRESRVGAAMLLKISA